MNYIKHYWIFFGSLLFGVFLWCVVYLLLPLKSVEPIKWETILYMISGYLALILGFISFNFNNIKKPTRNVDLTKTLTILLITIVLSYVIRWFDLFNIRELSFNIAPKENRLINSDNYSNSNLLFLLASVIKSIYFFPIVLVLSSKVKQKNILVLASYVVLLFPLVEAILKGTRKPFFELFIILILTWVIYQRHCRINFKRVVVVILGLVALMTISMMILINRETKSPQDKDLFYAKLFESRYNEILSPTSDAIAFFENPKTPEIVKFYAMIALHTGQYLTHGVFEFNHIVDYKNLPITYGKHTFMTIPKFINKIGVFNKIDTVNASPREYVYLTFFGDLYIDFRWMAMPIIFLIGMTQKYVFQKARHNIVYNPIVIYFLIINVFLLVVNYIIAAGIYTFFGFCFFLIILQLLQFITYEKSSST